jgi:nucleoside-triphosphatase THEP1
MNRPRVILLTGRSRAGKTTVCQAVVAAARLSGAAVSGVLTEDGVAKDGGALQIVQDLRTTERHLLATAHPGTGKPAAWLDAAETTTPVTPSALKWLFDPGGVEFGRRALVTAQAAGCGLLVVDQIGPLELHCGGGWTVAFDVVGAGRFDLGLIVVNPAVLQEAHMRLSGTSFETMTVDASTRDVLPQAIVSAFLSAD